MIKIERRKCPGCLNKKDSEIVKDDYRNPQVIEALKTMQHNKCCYCEKDLRLLERTEYDVEHFIPHSSLKDENGRTLWFAANTWENLLCSCRTCNSRKHFYPPYNEETSQQELIDPSCKDLDPEEHIDFIIDGNVNLGYKEKNGSALGKLTIERLKLKTRTDLRGKFRKIIAEINNYFNELITAIEYNNAVDINEKINQLHRAMSAHHPHAGFTRKYIRKRLELLNERELPKLGEMNKRAYNPVIVEIPIGAKIIY
jgi:uncharacterized protein (TIGR02646 family)